MPIQQERKAQTHARIVKTAARAIRRGGYQGTGVADIMNETVLTHGGFYAHFASRDAFLMKATEAASAMSCMLGALVLARAVSDPQLSAAIRTGAKDFIHAAFEYKDKR